MYDEEMQKDIFERIGKFMTLDELRQRLKHIAGLCWGLSIDIQNELERNAQLEKENKFLRAQNDMLSKRLNSRDRARMRSAGRPKKILTPEEEAEKKKRLREANRIAVKKYQAKKKAEKNN